MYLGDNDGVFFSKGNSNWRDWENLGLHLFQKLAPYCGISGDWKEWDGSTDLIRREAKVFLCPTAPNRKTNYSYGYNTWGLVEYLEKESVPVQAAEHDFCDRRCTPQQRRNLRLQLFRRFRQQFRLPGLVDQRGQAQLLESGRFSGWTRRKCENQYRRRPVQIFRAVIRCDPVTGSRFLANRLPVCAQQRDYLVSTCL